MSELVVNGLEASSPFVILSKIQRMEFPAFRFFERGQQLMRLQGYVVAELRRVIDHEYSNFVAHPMVKSKEDVPAWYEMVRAHLASGTNRQADVQLMFQMFFCRHVDNFQIFLEEMVRDIAGTHPALLDAVKVKGGQNLSPTELRLKRLDQISRLSLRRFSELLQSAIDFTLFTSESTAVVLERLYDVRNLIIHNYGIADPLFLSRHPDYGLVEGQSIQFEPVDIQTSFKELIEASGDIQKRAQARFKLWQRGN